MRDLEWEPEAKAAIDRAPFFIRRLARRKVEGLVRSEGRTLVTPADVRRAKSETGPAGTDLTPDPFPEGKGGQDVVPPSRAGKGDRGLGVAPLEPTSGLTEDQIRMIERLVDQIPGHETRYWSAKGCGGAVGCPLTLVDVQAANDAIAAAIESSGLAEAQAARLRGPVLSHHRFRAAIAGCANSCSEPQIKDFALVARARPSLGPGECVECLACEAACREGAVRVVDGGPRLDPERCVGCGACAEVCENQAIANSVGYDVMVGGRLGRHPRLAVTIAEGIPLEQALDLLRASLRLLVEEGKPGERLGAVLERVGFDRYRL